ncbi:MAG TPA: PmoA family protein [Thermomicrobiales bacterium]|nr:PmoA family protein [Thermomicrobiales bacterium]
MKISHTIGNSIDWYPDDASDPAWTLSYTGRPKPFFHPVRSPSGQLLSLLEPADHLWHRGLWFTIKFVNGDNFWEERPPFGTQRVAGLPEIRHPAPDIAELDLSLDWLAPDGGERVIAEQRTIRSRATADALVIDWRTELTAERDVTLDRTPYTTWGGYGGLSFRGSRSWLVDRFLLSGDRVEGRPAGQAGSWCEMSGPVDGGPDLSAGLAMLDHPDNPRHPTPWYAGGAGSGNFLNAALLFHEPMTLGQGETLALRYRILIHDGIWDATRLESEHARWLEGET